MKTFDIEGHVGIDVKVPSTVNPQSFVWVTACTKEVKNCSLAAAPDTEIVSDRSSCCVFTSTARGNPTPVVIRCVFPPPEGRERKCGRVFRVSIVFKVCGANVVKSYSKYNKTSDGLSRS